MGLRDDIVQDVREAFDNDLSEAATTFTATREQQGTYDPITDSCTDAQPLEITGRGVFSDYDTYHVDGVRVLATDQQLLCLTDELSEPLAINDLIGGYYIHGIQTDSLKATVTAQMRLLGGSDGLD